MILYILEFRNGGFYKENSDHSVSRSEGSIFSEQEMKNFEEDNGLFMTFHGGMFVLI